MENLVQSNRIQTVDALRGMALLGILLAHMIFWYSAGPLPQELFTKYKDIGSQIVPYINDILIAGKFFAFFSFLFGLSFYLQMQSMEKRQDNFMLRYGWRIILLGIIGLIHHAFWRGDILSIYAPLGLLLLPLRKASNKLILVLGILFALNVPGKLVDVIRFIINPKNVGFDFGGDPVVYYATMSKAGWKQLLMDNWNNLYDKFKFQVLGGRIYITYGFFLLGMYTGRMGWFRNVETAKPIFKKLCKRTAWLGLVLLMLAFSIIGANELFKLKWEQNPVVGFFFGIIYDTFNAALVVFYVTGLSLLMYKPSWQKAVQSFATVGKLALTCYLTQTALGLLLFYHVGFGLVGKTPPYLNWGIAFLFFGLQVIVGSWWLKRYNYGPIEWLWRSATFFKWYPMKKTTESLSVANDKTI
ncbi:MAG: DUF418 domain-containing protein [Sphingobacteriia bacterium]